jgi:putative membrane-bound dehydrogenase-like protein
MRMNRILASAIVFLVVGILIADPPPDQLRPGPATEPTAALQTVRLLDGYELQLVACEPQVTSPVAAAYDEDGRLYVVEMRDYPDPLKPGETPIGRVRRLEDRDGDGRYEFATIFADQLNWPTSVIPWDGGVFVTAAPDLWYFKDADGDGTSEIRVRAFTGFVVYNVQALVNGLQWGVDNRIHGVTAGNGGEVRPGNKPDTAPVTVRGRDFRFDPRTLDFEPTAGTAQFGNTFDDWYHRFVCANRLVAGHVPLPAHYLVRNPYLPSAQAIQDCAAEGANAPLDMFQISPAEPWRAVRAERYKAEGQKLALSEMVAKGVFTSGTGITIYRGDACPELRGQAFVGNPAGNLVHRRSLTPKGATFTASRIDRGCEFVASTDTWFRPVNFVNAPDGTLHVLDMYREVVEHPWSIPEDIKAKLDLTSGRDRGRIYRIAPRGFKPPAPPRLGQATTAELVKHLEHPNAWWRETAQRLLYQRQDQAAVPLLRATASGSKSPLGRLHALYALDGLGALGPREVLTALAHESAGLREHGMRLAEPWLRESPELAAAVRRLADDPEPRIRFQAALTLGNMLGDEVTDLLARIVRRDSADPWLRQAVLSSAAGRELALARRILSEREFAGSPPGRAVLLTLAGVVGANHQRGDASALVEHVATGNHSESVRQTVVTGVADGLLRTGRTLDQLSLAPPSAGRKLVNGILDAAVRTAADEKATPATRVRAIGLLTHAPLAETQTTLRSLLDAREPQDLQLAVVRALRGTAADAVPAILLGGWRGYSPAVRAEVLTTLSTRPRWAEALLDAVEAKTVAPADIGPATRAILLGHRDSGIQNRAKKYFGAATIGNRADVLARFQETVRKPGDAARGLAVFKRECAACHYAAGVGTSIGPAIAAVGNRTPEALLTAILDPNREVDPRYLTYTLTTDDGRALSGMITGETATTVTLRRAEGAETILRTQIDQLRSAGVSLMPEGLEANLKTEEMADLLAFLASVK